MVLEILCRQRGEGVLMNRGEMWAGLVVCGISECFPSFPIILIVDGSSLNFCTSSRMKSGATVVPFEVDRGWPASSNHWLHLVPLRLGSREGQAHGDTIEDTEANIQTSWVRGGGMGSGNGWGSKNMTGISGGATGNSVHYNKR